MSCICIFVLEMLGGREFRSGKTCVSKADLTNPIQGCSFRRGGHMVHECVMCMYTCSMKD